MLPANCLTTLISWGSKEFDMLQCVIHSTTYSNKTLPQSTKMHLTIQCSGTAYSSQASAVVPTLCTLQKYISASRWQYFVDSFPVLGWTLFFPALNSFIFLMESGYLFYIRWSNPNKLLVSGVHPWLSCDKLVPNGHIWCLFCLWGEPSPESTLNLLVI